METIVFALANNFYKVVHTKICTIMLGRYVLLSKFVSGKLSFPWSGGYLLSISDHMELVSQSVSVSTVQVPWRTYVCTSLEIVASQELLATVCCSTVYSLSIHTFASSSRQMCGFFQSKYYDLLSSVVVMFICYSTSHHGMETYPLLHWYIVRIFLCL